MKGYQLLLDSEFLNQVMGMVTAHDELKYSIMHWLVHELRKNTEIRSLCIEIDVVKINFHGSTYPGIGIHYLNQNPGLNFTDKDNTADYGNQIEAKIAEIYQSESFLNFFDYIQKNQMEIYQCLQAYKSK
ncbi:hypothetical protein GXP67_02325 [Rhodocytophaga rosea]|uniref:Uncharacterized protein n=1 Tax=Rhodocytophaga rosea TaxID=2704465 RepID=A0A6C0GC74_9BACT|nr:hypothetical protein [Rhodocytophaga rosea]QHT65579.1 hypothetical protein GXP67_02325 [Rhodocytophaga rosea]